MRKLYILFFLLLGIASVFGGVNEEHKYANLPALQGKPAPPSYYFDSGVTRVDRYLCLGGGDDEEHTTSTLNIYNTHTQEWIPSTISMARTDLAASSMEIKNGSYFAYFVGGRDIHKTLAYSTIDVFDVSRQKSYPLTAKLSESRYDLAVVAVSNVNNVSLLIAAGGKTISEGVSAVVDIFDAHSNYSRDVQLLSVARDDISAAVHYSSDQHTQIVVFAGGDEGVDQPSSAVDILTIHDGVRSWNRSTLSVARKHLRGAVAANTVIFVGGLRFDDASGKLVWSNLLEFYNIEQNTWHSIELGFASSTMQMFTIWADTHDIERQHALIMGFVHEDRHLDEVNEDAKSLYIAYSSFNPLEQTVSETIKMSTNFTQGVFIPTSHSTIHLVTSETVSYENEDGDAATREQPYNLVYHHCLAGKPYNAPELVASTDCLAWNCTSDLWLGQGARDGTPCKTNLARPAYCLRTKCFVQELNKGLTAAGVILTNFFFVGGAIVIGIFVKKKK